MIHKYKIYYLSGGSLKYIDAFIKKLEKDGYELVKNDENWYIFGNQKYIVNIKDNNNNLYEIEFHENYPFKPIKINNIYEIQEHNWSSDMLNHVKIINNLKSLYELIPKLNEVDIKAVIGAKYEDYNRINNVNSDQQEVQQAYSQQQQPTNIVPVITSGTSSATMPESSFQGNSNQEKNKFNLFFDIENENKYYQNEDLYTINMDFNNVEKYKFFSVLNNKFSLIAFDYSTVKFLNNLDIIKYLLDFLNYEGKLYLPIRNSGGFLITIDFKDENVLDYLKNNDIINYNKFYNEMMNFKKNYGDFTFNNLDKTFTLNDNDKIDNIINSDKTDLIPYSIIYKGSSYKPDAEQIKNIFIKKIEKMFNNNNDYKIEIILDENYPFEPSEELIQSSNTNYIEEHIVIKKINL